MRELLRAAWQRWKLLAEKISHVQARILFGLLYFVVVSPFAVAIRVFADPLQIRQKGSNPLWRDLTRQTLTLEDARKQF